MTLTRRLSFFFLTMLAVVLLGFAVTLFVLARNYLYRQAGDHLIGALDTLVVSVENGPAGLEWEPTQRPLPLRAGSDPLIWQVRDGANQLVDGEGPIDVEQLLAPAGMWPERVHWHGGDWLIGVRQMQAATAKVESAGQPRYRTLRIAAAISLEPVTATLRQLAGALAAVSSAIWLLAWAAGWYVCRRALRPIRRMAQAARSMKAAEIEQRLPTLRTRDELHDLSQAFNGLLDRLQDSFQRQQRFAGQASHQLRTPLTALLGQVEVTLRRPRGAEEYREALVAVQAQGLHLRKIVEALLFLTRADAEADLPGLEIIALGPWLEEHLTRWQQPERGGDIHLESAPGEMLAVRAQPILLGEVVNILVENACKYSPPGTPITLQLARDQRRIRLTVVDRGCGITAEDLPHVCEPFFRSAEARQRGVTGVGLGLAIAQRLVKAFGGTLSAESGRGQGSRFNVYLPAVRVDNASETGHVGQPVRVPDRERDPGLALSK